MNENKKSEINVHLIVLCRQQKLFKMTNLNNKQATIYIFYFENWSN